MSAVFHDRVKGDSLILKAAGNLAEHDCGDLIGALQRGLRPDVSRVILDLDGVSHISSAVLMRLAAERPRLADAGCRLVLACTNREVRELLSMTLADDAVPIVRSVETGLRAAAPARSGDRERILGPDGMVG